MRLRHWIAACSASLLAAIATPAAAQVDWSALKLEFVTPTGVVGPTESIDVWLRLTNTDASQSFTVDNGLALGGLNPGNLPTQGWLYNPDTGTSELVDFASYTSFSLGVGFGCSGSFTTQCTDGPPYQFNFADDPFGDPYALAAGETHSYLFGSFSPSHGPVAAGSYEFYRSVLWLDVFGLDAAGNSISAIVFPTSTCPFDDAGSCNAAGFSYFTRVVAVPEPGSWALMALGLAAVGGVARRRLGR